jgi:hypothetical protein
VPGSPSVFRRHPDVGPFAHWRDPGVFHFLAVDAWLIRAGTKKEM